MERPSVAFILGAGLGERLRPMTYATPKPLIPMWNRPLLAHTLDKLQSWGVREVYINTHWLSEKMHDFITAYEGDLTLHECHEPEILGTGGCLRALKPHLCQEPFWLVNGDIVFDCAPDPFMEAYEQSGRFAAAWLEPHRGPRTVETDYAGRITCWSSPTPAVERTFTFTGVSLLSPEVIDFLPQAKTTCSIIEAFEAAMFSGRLVQAVVQKGAYWNDVGTPEAYLQAHRDVKRLPELHAYARDIKSKPPSELRPLLKTLGWDAAETIILPLGARGSQRTFWRLVGTRRSIIAIAYQSVGREENKRYTACAKALSRVGIAVPHVVLDQPGLMALEDLGDRTFDRYVSEINEAQAFMALHADANTCSCDDETCSCGHSHVPAPTAHPKLAAVMSLLAAFHSADIGDLPLEPAFDQALYDWEVGLYEQFVTPFSAAAKAELAQLHATLLAEPTVLTHRDFQSSNVLWHKEKPYVIDFQGMRRGAALYDLASFLYDPYVRWQEEVITPALHAYAKAANCDVAALENRLPCAVVQRLIQAIGAYHRLASVGQPRFLKYVPIARKRAAAAAKQLGYAALAAELSDI